MSHKFLCITNGYARMTKNCFSRPERIPPGMCRCVLCTHRARPSFNNGPGARTWKTQSAWLLAAVMAIAALLWACGAPSPNGDPLHRPTEDEETAKPKPGKGDGGASSGSSTKPQMPPADGGAAVPSNKLVLASISPVSATAGSPATTLTVNGGQIRRRRSSTPRSRSSTSRSRSPRRVTSRARLTSCASL